MIGPSEVFSAIVQHSTGCVGLRPSDVPDAKTIEREYMAAMQAHGLILQPENMVGYRLVFPAKDGTPLYLARTPIYTLAKPDEVLAATRAHIARIAETHGPGCVWFLAAPVHVVNDDGMLRADLVDGDPHVRVRTFYGHEAQATP